MKKLFFVVGTRPNIIKLSPIPDLATRYPDFDFCIVHTGQHYDYNMSQVFFDELALPRPDFFLETDNNTQARQTASVMTAFEDLCIAEKPVGVVVFGDVNSSLAAALAAAKLHIPCFHIEAGLRSFNRSMPEEINRIVCDHVCDRLYAPSPTAMKHLENEGLVHKALLCGDVMYDAMKRNKGLAENKSQIMNQLGLTPGHFHIATLHRPYNVDDKHTLSEIIGALRETDEKIVFAIHPRTAKNLKTYCITIPNNIIITEPLGYFDFLALLQHTAKVITDSGGIQKEAYFAAKPCITLRPETEWTETVACGANTLVTSRTKTDILNAIQSPAAADFSQPFYGHGNAAELILDDITTCVK
ncbi:MAG: UDP-2,3-diacetamido-2,3-dideoxy-D-glucuronate 2-epimerase [Bacteroidetes bacterium ADurb.Bin408]|nr:MAG: UDP-2,3-diacetamido-2,3-dideoxy-D-glucuronate 2-epimerase [Bacteroidetes bacterium ADurb.Bin408]